MSDVVSREVLDMLEALPTDMYVGKTRCRNGVVSWCVIEDCADGEPPSCIAMGESLLSALFNAIRELE